MCSKKPSSNKLVSLRGLFLLVPICHPDVNNTWVLLSFSLQWHNHWEPGLEFAVPEYLPSSLTDCWQCAHNPPLPGLSWCHVCLPSLPTPLLITVVQASYFLTFCPPFPGLRSLVSMHGKYWVVAYHSAEMGFRSKVWEEEMLWLCTGSVVAVHIWHYLKIRIVSALERACF